MFKRIGSIYNYAEEILLVVCIITMVLVVFLQVIMRYVFNNSLSWSEELARMIFIWASWIGISFGQKRGEHIKIILLTDNLRGKAKLIVLFIADICTLAILIVLIIKGYEVMEKISMLGAKSPALYIPKWVPYASIPISCGLMATRVVKEMVTRFMRKEKGLVI